MKFHANIRYLLMLAAILCLNGCWELNSNPKKPSKKMVGNDYPYLREAVGDENVDLLKKFSEEKL